MARKKFTTEQIIQNLRTIEIEVGKAMTVEDATRKHNIPVQAYYRWKKEYAGMDLNQSRKLSMIKSKSTKIKKSDIIVNMKQAWGDSYKKTINHINFKLDKDIKFKKPVKVQSKNKFHLFTVNLSGMKHQFKNNLELKEILSKLEDYSEVSVKHEYKNKHDPFALAVYYNFKKIGYIASGWSQNIILAAEKGIRFDFYISRIISLNKVKSGKNMRILVYPKTK